MKRASWVLLALLFLAVHVVYTGRHTSEERLVRIADGAELSLAKVVSDLFRARFVFVGELHDQPAHHAAQLRVLQAFHEADQPVAVGLEMFRAESQPVLDRWSAGALALEEFLPVYYKNWSLPWEFYREIFLYAREHAIPLVGLNVPQATVQQVAREGFASLTAEQVGELPPIRCEVSPTYEDFIRRAMGMHASRGRAFQNFCEAQLVWDTAMAVNLLKYLDANPEHAVVVVAGSGHAWKRGIPDQVRRIREVPMRVIVPQIPRRLDRSSIGPDDADYLWEGLALE